MIVEIEIIPAITIWWEFSKKPFTIFHDTVLKTRALIHVRVSERPWRIKNVVWWAGRQKWRSMVFFDTYSSVELRDSSRTISMAENMYLCLQTRKQQLTPLLRLCVSSFSMTLASKRFDWNNVCLFGFSKCQHKTHNDASYFRRSRVGVRVLETRVS